MRRFLSIIAAASRKFSIPLYLDKYIIMDYDGTKQKDRQLFLTESIACAAIPERSGRVFFMSHNLLSINAQVSIKINRDTAIFLNKCLENRKIRINTHTHTHTHTQGLARQDITKYLIIKGLRRTIPSGYPRPSIIIHQKYSIPPCFQERSGMEVLSGDIHPTGFPCLNVARFLYTGYIKRPPYCLNLK